MFPKLKAIVIDHADVGQKSRGNDLNQAGLRVSCLLVLLPYGSQPISALSHTQDPAQNINSIDVIKKPAIKI